jgi:hypothetical protein
LATEIGQSWMLAGRRIVDPDDRAAQQLLAVAHARQTRPLCQCVEGGAETYVAKTPGGRFVIKRMPHSGPRHHPGCDSYEPPQALSGRGTIATGEDADGASVLPLGFPLTRGPARQDYASRTGPGRNSRHPDPAGPLSLEALLHYLWDEAGFTRWSPRMAGKRNWSLVRYHLTRVAEQTVIADRCLDELVWIPEPFALRHRDQIEARRKEAWAPLLEDNAERRRFGVAVLEWAGIKPARYGTAIAVKQMAWPPFMVEDVVLAALTARFPQLDLHTQHPDGHLVMTATFSLSRGGYPVVEDAAFLSTDPNWLPYDTEAGHDLLEAAVAAQRRFTTPLRYGMAASQPLPVLVLTDTHEPVAAYIASSGPDAERAQQAAQDAGVPAWVWHSDHDLLPLPPPG